MSEGIVAGYDPSRGVDGSVEILVGNERAWVSVGKILAALPLPSPKRSPWSKPPHAPTVTESRVLLVRHVRGSGAPGDRCREVATYYLANPSGEYEVLVEHDTGPV